MMLLPSPRQIRGSDISMQSAEITLKKVE